MMNGDNIPDLGKFGNPITEEPYQVGASVRVVRENDCLPVGVHGTVVTCDTMGVSHYYLITCADSGFRHPMSHRELELVEP